MDKAIGKLYHIIYDMKIMILTTTVKFYYI